MKQPIKRTATRKTIATSARRRINLSSSLHKSKARLSESKTTKNTEQPKGLLDKIILSCLVIIFSVCPLFFVGLSAQGIGFEKMILFYFLVLVGFVVYIAKGILDGELQFKRTILDWPILGLVIVAIISTSLSVGVKDSLIGAYGSLPKSLAALLIFVLFYYLLINNINAQRIKTLFWSLIVSSSVVTIYSIAQLFGIFILPFKFAQSVNFNPIGASSSLAMFLVISIPLLIIGINHLKGVGKIAIKVLLLIILFLNLIILIALKGFAFWPIVIVGAVIIIIAGFSKIVEMERANIFFPIGILLISIVFLIGNFNIFKLDVPAEISLSRLASWEIAKSSLEERPIFGSGLSTFYYSFGKYKDVNLNKTNLWNVNFDNAMGLFFESLATLGILGTLAIIILLIIGTVLSFLSILKIKDTEYKMIMLGLFTSLVSIIGFSFLFSFSGSLIIYSALILFLCFASAAILGTAKLKICKLTFRSKERYKLIAVFFTICIIIITLIILGCRMYLADVYAKQSISETTIDGKISKLNQAIKLFSPQDSYHIGLSNYYTLLSNQAAVQGDKDAAQNNLNMAVKFSKKAVEIAPNKSGNNKSLALLYENTYLYDRGSLEKAEAEYKKVIELDPSNPTPYLRIGLINMAKSNAETETEEKKYYINEAIKEYDKAISKKNNLSGAYHAKSIAYENLGDVDQAIQSLAKASNIDPNNVEYRFELGRLYFNKGISISNAPKDISGYTEQEVRIMQIRKSRGLIEPNNELKASEQLFLSILLENQNHANARYSLALLYNKIGDIEKTSIMVKSLLKILEDEKQKELIKQQFPGMY